MTLITHRGQDAIGQKDPGLKLTRSTHCSQLKPQQHITYTKLAFISISKDKRLLQFSPLTLPITKSTVRGQAIPSSSNTTAKPCLEMKCSIPHRHCIRQIQFNQGNKSQVKQGTKVSPHQHPGTPVMGSHTNGPFAHQ